MLAAASTADADEIFEVINAAYSLEIGNDGIAFKNENIHRLMHPLEDSIRSSYESGKVIKAVLNCDGTQKVVGVIVWDIIDVQINGEQTKSMYFGPFAIRPDYQKRGIGGILLTEIDRIARMNCISYVDINVINHRSDLLPMYAKLGYEDTGTTSDYPFRERLSRDSHFINLRRKIN
jgi:predicted N-acetyltransferase YhbS